MLDIFNVYVVAASGWIVSAYLMVLLAFYFFLQSSVKMKLLCGQVMRDLLGEQIDVRHMVHVNECEQDLLNRNACASLTY